jgi:hypothetical protein
MPSYFQPLSQVLPAALIPAGLLAVDPESDGALDVVGITGYAVEPLPEGVYVAADLGIDPDQDQDPTIVLALPAFPDVGLELASLARLDVWIQEDFRLRLAMGVLSIRLPRALLRAVEWSESEGKWVQAGDGIVRATLAYDPAGSGVVTEHLLALTIDGQGRISLERPDGSGGVIEASLSAPAMIGDTGVVIEVERLGLDLHPEHPALHLDRATVRLPPDVEGAPAVEFTDARITPEGFSGTVAATWPLEFADETKRFVYRDGGTVTDAKLFGLDGGLRQIAVTLEDNRLTGAELAGGLVIPYFDEAVDVRLDIEPGGDFLVTLLGVGEEGLTLTKEELLSLHLKALTIEKRGEVGGVTVSGGLEPLILSRDGLQWPRLDVVGLSIDTEGRFRVQEAWLDLEKLEPLDLWGFGFDLKRVGLGYEEGRDRLWLDLSGGLRLIQQIPMGFDVEGFRLSWPREVTSLDQLASQVEVQFAGIHLFYGIPDAVEFEGLIRFFRDAQVVGFAGDVALRVPATGLAIEAGLMIGMVLDPPPFPFLYVYLGVELPAGIPLGQSGLALKGALGLFGLNVRPAKTAEENWYYDWYKRPPLVGAHPTNKWEPAQDAIALGVGVTITTVDGYVKGVRGLVVLSIPGPILIIEGRGLVFNGLLPAEPPLRALAVFDGAAQTVQFNLEARAVIVEDVLEAWGGLEAFFDFKDLTNWHLYLGQDQPADRRIQANILKLAAGGYLFNASAYLMLDMVGAHTLRSRMGFLVGLEQTYDEYDPLLVELSAAVGGDGVVTVGPEELSGRVTMEAALRLSTFGFGCRLSAAADVLAEAPNPFSVDATLRVAADLPDPLEDFEAEFHFAWTGPSDVTVEPPLVGASATSDLLPEGGALALGPEGLRTFEGPGGEDGASLASRMAEEAPGLLDSAQAVAEAAPVVPMDARPTLAFAHDMNDATDGLFARDPRGGPFSHDLGRIRLSPTLRRIDLYRHRSEQPWSGDFETDWRRVGSTEESVVGAGVERLWGTWLADAAPDEPGTPGTRRLRLWTANPFVVARAGLGKGYQTILSLGPPTDGSRQAHADDFLASYSDYFRCQDAAVETCVDFDGAPDPTAETDAKPDAANPLRWAHGGLGFAATGPVTLRPGRRRFPIGPGGLDPAGFAGARGALGELERSFGRMGLPLPASVLAEWARGIPAALRDRLRGERPDLPWDFVVPGPACLEVDGDLHVRFPEPVRRVRLRFCAAPGLGAAQARARLSVERPPRTIAEIEAERRRAAQKGEKPDLAACRIPVPFTLTVAGDTWTIETTVPFECLTIRSGARLEAVCYVTAAETERAGRAGEECERNKEVLEQWSDEPPVLDPNAYYRVCVHTTVDVQRLNVQAGSVPELIRGLTNELYKVEMRDLVEDEDSGSFGFIQETFFRVDGPPAALAPYVGWTHPESQAARVFREDDMRLRFRRAGVARMFQRPAHRLEVLVRHVDGGVLPCTPEWSKAGAATRFPDEQAWLDHLGSDAPALPLDDVLTGGRSAVALAAGARHELLVTGGVGGALLLEDRFVGSTLGAPWGTPVPSGFTVRPILSAGAEGELVHGGVEPAHLVAGDPTWTDLDIVVEVRGPDRGAAGIVFRYAEDPRTGAPTCFRLVLDRESQSARIEQVNPTGALASEPYRFDTPDDVFPPGAWVRLRVSIVGSRIRAWRFDTRLFDLERFVPARPSGRPGAGRIVRDGPAPNGPPAGRAGVYAEKTGTAFRRFAVRDAVLLRVPFTTSAHARFQDLVATFPGHGAPVPPTAPSVSIVPWSAPEAAAAVDAVMLASAAYAKHALDWERALVDLRYQELDRAALEVARTKVRESAAFLDDAVVALAADTVKVPMFDASPERLTVTTLRSEPDGAVRGFWLRSPESLDVERPGSAGHVGRTRVSLRRRAASGAPSMPVDARWVANAGSTEILFLPGTAGLGATWPAGEYSLTLAYHRRHTDEDATGHHRFDRPSEPRGGSDTPDEVTIAWTV